MVEKLSQTSFQWFIGIFITLVLATFSYQQTQISRIQGEMAVYKDDVFKSINQLSRDISTVQNDISWIKKTLSSAEITK